MKLELLRKSPPEAYKVIGDTNETVGIIHKGENAFYFEPLSYLLFGEKTLGKISRILSRLNKKINHHQPERAQNF